MKTILLIAMSILLIASASAQLIIEPINIVVKVDQPQTFQITLNNTFNFTIEDLEFEGLDNFDFPYISIPSKQSKTYDFTVEMPESHFGLIQSRVKFKYEVNLPEEITTHYINITATAYDPNYITIRNGDTITWTNKDDITHTVTSGSFDYTISVNNTVSHIFNNIGTTNYNDLILFYAGTIEVVNRTEPQKVQNPNYDAIWNVDLTSVLNPTTLEISTIETGFEIEATDSTEDMLKVKNTGTETAERIELTSSLDWIDFEFNNFSLNMGETKWIRYTITPLVFNTTETNKSYSINIKAKASNSQEYKSNINVFIPYTDVFGDYSTDEGFVVWFTEVFCPQNPQLFICDTTAKGKVEEVIIYRDPEIPINLTVTEFYNLLKRIQKMEDTFQRTSNQQVKDSEVTTSSQTRMESMLNKSLKRQIENEEKASSTSTANWIIGFSIFLSLCIIVVIFYFNKYKTQKSITEVYEPKY